MDSQRFDAISRWFAGGDTRRALFAKLGAVGLGATVATVVTGFTPADTEAASKAACKRRCRKRFKDRDQRKKKRKCLKKCNKQAAACTTSAQCQPGQLCAANGTCVTIAGCAQDSDCGTGRECTNSQCVDSGSACATPADCGLGQTCTTGTCQTAAGFLACAPNGACDPGFVCVEALGLCLTDLGSCPAGTCTPGQTCVANICVPGTDGTCAISGSSCESGDECCGSLLCLQVDLLQGKICVGL